MTTIVNEVNDVNVVNVNANQPELTFSKRFDDFCQRHSLAEDAQKELTTLVQEVLMQTFLNTMNQTGIPNIMQTVIPPVKRTATGSVAVSTVKKGELPLLICKGIKADGKSSCTKKFRNDKYGGYCAQHRHPNPDYVAEATVGTAIKTTVSAPASAAAALVPNGTFPAPATGPVTRKRAQKPTDASVRQCASLKADKKSRCNRNAKDGSDYCFIHTNNHTPYNINDITERISSEEIQEEMQKQAGVPLMDVAVSPPMEEDYCDA